MKNTPKRILKAVSLSILCAMTVAFAASCKSNGGDNADDEDSVNLTGFTLNVLSPDSIQSSEYTAANLMYTEEADGDTMREAIYSRNSKLNGDYGLEITQTISEDVIGDIIKITAAQDDAYQIATIGGSSCISYIEQNLFDNAYDIPHVNLDAEYWDGDIMENLAVNGFSVGFAGDILFENYEGMRITMYNRPLADDFAVENLYEVANAGGWTYDKMMTEMEKVITDLDNDGQYTFADRVGLLYAKNNSEYYFASGDINFVKKDKEGNFYFDETENERASMLAEKLQKLFLTKGYSLDWLAASDGIKTIIGMIENKQILFQIMVISQVRRFYREIKTDFGLLPLPKMNEEQERYCDTTAGPTIVVPSSNLDLERTGYALEVIAKGSAEFPNIYFHVCLESKFTRDAESIDMIMLCYRNSICDPLYYFDIGNFADALLVVCNSNRNYATVYANCSDAIQEDLLALEDLGT